MVKKEKKRRKKGQSCSIGISLLCPKTVSVHPNHSVTMEKVYYLKINRRKKQQEENNLVKKPSKIFIHECTPLKLLMYGEHSITILYQISQRIHLLVRIYVLSSV